MPALIHSHSKGRYLRYCSLDILRRQTQGERSTSPVYQLVLRFAICSPSVSPSVSLSLFQVGAQTETELKEKKLRVEDALNATKAAVDEGIVIGGGCTLLKLAAAVDDAFKVYCLSLL